MRMTTTLRSWTTPLRYFFALSWLVAVERGGERDGKRQGERDKERERERESICPPFPHSPNQNK